MAFTLEDGTGVTGANAYISVAFFTDHHTDRGRDVSSISASNVQSAIIRATDYVDQRFGRKFRGFRQQKSQALEWPRLSAEDDDGFLLDALPAQLQKGVAEYSLRAHILKELAPDAPRAAPSQDFSDATSAATVTTGTSQASGIVTQQKRKVGPIETVNAYASQAEIQALLRDRRSFAGGLVSGVYIPEYPTADLWIAELLATGSRDLSRA